MSGRKIKALSGGMRRRVALAQALLGDPDLRPLFFNTVLVSGLILATAPLMAVLMLSELGFSPFAYAVAYSSSSSAWVSCDYGFIGLPLSCSQ